MSNKPYIHRLSAENLRIWVLSILILGVQAMNPIWADGLVIRGGTCSADAFKNGSGVSIIPPGSNNIFDLSVNCTNATNKKQNFNAYTAGIPGPNYCVATIADLERAGIKIKPDPTKTNPIHCLVSGDANKIAGKLTRYP